MTVRSSMRRALVIGLAGFSLVGALGGCGGAAPRPVVPAPVGGLAPADDLGAAADGAKATPGAPGAATDPRADAVDLGTIQIKVVGTGADGEPQLVATEPGLLLERGAAEAKAGRADAAIATFRELVRDFPDSPAAPVALANIAIVEEGRRNIDGAVGAWLERALEYPAGRDALEAHLRAAALEAQRSGWPVAEGILGDITARADLTYADQLEVWARLGYVQMQQGKDADAQASLDKALAAGKRAPRLADTYYAAMATYYAGELAHRKFAAATLRADDAYLRPDLDAKEALGDRAYAIWRDALQFRQAYWATASGYQMSNIFYDFWLATVRAPYPTGLDPKARAQYVVEVHARVRDRLEKALDGHRTNLELAAAYGVDTYWSLESAARAVEILRVLDAEDRGVYITPDHPDVPPAPAAAPTP
jgi:hypothetical protein